MIVDREELEERLDAHRSSLDAVFESESVDREWADNVSYDLSTTIEGARVEGMHVASLECRATLCRMQLDFEVGADPIMFMDTVAGKPGFHLPGFAHLVDADDERTLHVFVGRYDDTLPPHP